MYDNTHRHGLTEQDQANLLHAIGIFVRTAIADALAPIERRLILLESKGISFHGAYQRGASYDRHSVVVQSNTMWVSVAPVEPNQIPGLHPSWVLCDKSQAERERRRATQGGPRTSNVVERRT